MIPYDTEKDFKTLLNAFKRIGKGIYKNEKEAMQKIYSTTEILFQNNVEQNPVFLKILCLLIESYIYKYGTAKQAIFMISKNTDTKIDLLLFKIKDLINTNELFEVTEAVKDGVINENQKEAILNNANKWTDEHIKKSVYTFANELIFNERANEL